MFAMLGSGSVIPVETLRSSRRAMKPPAFLGGGGGGGGGGNGWGHGVSVTQVGPRKGVGVGAGSQPKLCCVGRCIPGLLFLGAALSAAYAAGNWLRSQDGPLMSGRVTFPGSSYLGFGVSDEVSPVRDEEVTGPVRFETLMALWRVVASAGLEVVGAMCTPVDMLFEHVEAALLHTTVHRLLDVPVLGPQSGTPPWWAKSAMKDACEAVLSNRSRLHCPSLHVVPHESNPHIVTLPVGIWKRRHRIFISKGLLDVGVNRGELTALLAREVAHLKAFRWRPPAWWALVGAWRSKRAPNPKGSLQSLPIEMRRELRQGWAQLLELCRMQAATTAAASVAARTEELGPVSAVADWWLQRVDEYAVLVDVCDFIEAPHTSFSRAEMIARFAMTYTPYEDGVAAVRRGAAAVSSRFGALPAMGILSGTQLPAKKPPARTTTPADGDKKWPSLPGNVGLSLREVNPATVARPALLGLLAVGRVAEMSADRSAAKKLGSIEPVAAGLVRLYGTEEERRRVDRGDIRGIIMGSRTALEARGGLLRWEMWFESLVTGPTQPPLMLRLADLAAWEELGDRGRFMPWRRKGASSK